MPNKDMGPKTQELIQVLNKIIVLLKEDGETHWLNWMESSMNRLLKSDYSGIEHLLGAYGGMGSFSDLVIGQLYEDGKFQWKPGAQINNDTLDQLRSDAYQLADFVKRNHDIGKA